MSKDNAKKDGGGLRLPMDAELELVDASNLLAVACDALLTNLARVDASFEPDTMAVLYGVDSVLRAARDKLEGVLKHA